MDDKSKKLLYAVMFDREKEFRTILDQYEEDLDEMSYDEKNNNLIHFLAYNNRLQMMKVALEVFKSKCKDRLNLQDRIHRWINGQNTKGLTPIFYAVYNGNLVNLLGNGKIP